MRCLSPGPRSRPVTQKGMIHIGCGCQGGAASAPKAAPTQNFQLVAPDGTKTTYPTETAARAANAKLGGRGLIKKLK